MGQVGKVASDPSKNAIAIGKQLTEVKISNIIRDIGLGIAKAQFDLDTTSMRIAQMMSGTPYDTGDIDQDGNPIIAEAHKVDFNGKQYSMIELGFTPTFYQFVDTIIEVKMSISMSSEDTQKNSKTTAKAAAIGGILPFGIGGGAMVATTVSASFASKYQYSAEGSSLVRTKLVPVPPPAILEERIRKLIDEKANP